jgi:hypothetical protein
MSAILTTCTAGFKPDRPIITMFVTIQERDRSAAISTAHNVVPVEHRARFVPADRHRHALGHPEVDHAPDSGTPAVMLEQARQLGRPSPRSGESLGSARRGRAPGVVVTDSGSARPLRCGKRNRTTHPGASRR